MSSNRRVSYFYDAEVGNYHYGQGKMVRKANNTLRADDDGDMDVTTVECLRRGIFFCLHPNILP